MTTTPDYDVLIAGAGLVGASLACALSGQGLRVAIIETRVPNPKTLSPQQAKLLGLSLASQRIFSGLGLWDSLSELATPIEHVRVSDRGYFGKTAMHASELGVAALGYVVPSNELLGQLWQRLHTTDIEIIAPATVESADIEGNTAAIVIEQDGAQRTVTASLLVAADGSESRIRRQLGIEEREQDYQQTAIVTSVQTGLPHNNTAFERFTSAGPVALLPYADRMALIWTVSSDQVESLAALSDADFIARVQGLFGRRLGAFSEPGARGQHALKMVQATGSTPAHAVVIGNAAQTLHPVASQGFNLGLRDVAWLAEVIVDAQQSGAEIGSEAMLKTYTKHRESDTRRISAFSSNLVGLFGNRFMPVVAARNLAMVALQILPPLRHRLMRTAMGMQGRQPRLIRGAGL